MIHVDRQRVPVPSILTSELVDQARKELEKYFSIDRQQRSQSRFPFNKKLWDETFPDLQNLFLNKCAYCESPIIIMEGLVDHFRPIGDAIGLEKQIFPDGYWWLAYNWENLYLVCKDCAATKSNRFPVAGAYPEPMSFGEKLRQDQALLLDPCYDQPAAYLQFQADGSVIPVERPDPATSSGEPGYNRGEITIEILGLNRRALLAARGQEAGRLMDNWKRLVGGPLELAEKNLPALLEAISDQAPFAGMARSLLSNRLDDARQDPNLLSPGFVQQLAPLAEKLGVSLEAPQVQITQEVGTKELSGVEFSPPILPPKRPRKTRAKPPRSLDLGTSASYIQRIEISNYKAITQLSLELPGPFTGEAPIEAVIPSKTDPTPRMMAPWMVLLGENGTGKSTVLQAVALALVGKPLAEQYRLRPAKLLHRTPTGRATQGSVKVWLSDQAKPVEVRFDDQTFRFYNRPAVSSLYVRGFGATRLLPKGEDRPFPSDNLPQMDVENLFDPFDPLFDAEKWLPGLDESRFDSLALTYKDILGLEDLKVKEDPAAQVMKTFQRSGESILVTDPFGVQVGLDELSDGYQSVLALATDIVAGVQERLTDFRNAPGIILIDEIGANLHPRWRMTFVKSLRSAFPRMQFIVTTHEPLCLRGLEDREVAVVQRQGNELVVLDKDLPSPKRMRAGQLLTSRYFGLHSTIDPDIDSLFQTYYDLLARRASETDDGLQDDQRALLQQLKEKINNTGPMILGNSRRDQMVYELIDEYLAVEGKEGSQKEGSQKEGPQNEKTQEMKEKTKKRVFEIWQRARAFANQGLAQEEGGEI